MKANLIKSLRNKIELVDIEAGRSARANFSGVNFDNAVLLINGRISEPDTIIQDNDIVTLRQLPGDATDADNWWIYTFFIPFGFIIQPAVLGYTARKQADEAERELEKIKKLTNAPEIDNSPFLRGATNTIATGKSQPYFCGRNFLTPYLFSQPYYKISGTDGATQEVYNILEGGFKDIVLNKLGIGDTTIKTFNDSAPQNGVFTIDSGIFADGVLEVRQNGDAFTTLTELNKKVISNVINREVAKEYRVTAGDDEYTVISLDPNAKDVDVCINFPYGLYKYNDDNDRVSAEVTITPEYSLDGGTTWTAFTFNQGGTASNVFNRNETKALRFVAHKDFTLANYTTLAGNSQNCILIRVRSNAPDDQKYRADAYVYFYQSVIFDPLKSSTPAGVLDDSGAAGLVDCLNVEERERGYSCVLGLKLVATTNNEKKLSQINIIATSTARTWNGSAWSETKAPTRNPAAIALEVATSDVHPASRYNDSEIDLDAFGAFYEYCESNDLYFDDLITQQQKKDAELQKIADVCGCAFYKDIYGRISVAIDQAQENAVAVYNPQNIISLTNKKTFARRVDALRIKYIDSTNDTYKQNTYTVTRLENGQPVTIDENSIIKEIEVKGITRQSQIVKYGRRLMAVDELRPVTTTLKIGAEGVYFTPYAKIGIQDPSINRDAQDAVIAGVTYQGGLLKKITLKNPVTFTDPLKLYGVVINTTSANGASPLALKVSGTGTTRELDVLTTYSASATHQPEANNVVSFGELDENGNFTKITHEYVITRIARTSGGFNLDLQEYNEAIYNPGTIPAYKPLVNNTPTPEAGEIPVDAVTHEELTEAATASAGDAAQEAVDLITRGYRFSNAYKISAVPPTSAGARQPLAARENVPQIMNTLESLREELDEVLRQANAGISITDDKITISVSDSEKKTTALIELTAAEIRQLVSDEIAGTISYIDQTAGKITARVESDEGTITQLGLDLGGLTTRVQTAEGDISALDQDVDSISGRVQTAEGNITQLNVDVGGLSTRVQTAEGNITALDQDMTSVTARVQTNEGAITQLGLDVTGLTSVVQSNDQKQTSRIEQTQNGLIAMIDDALRNAQAGISLTADGLTIQIEDTDKQLRSTIEMTAGGILEQVDDMARELTGLIDVQAGAVTALVEGGGATGQMSLSLNLPILIDATKRAEFVTASSEEKVAAVYALVEGTTYYGIKGNASNAAVKALWDDAVTAGLIASQIVLSADQINIAGKTIYTSSKTEAISAADAAAAQSAAISAAASDATAKAGNALADAEDYADGIGTTAENNRQALITALSQDPTAGHTVIDGGYLRTSLIEVENLLTKTITVKDKGIITSANYDGTIDNDGNITAYGSTGWAIDHAGKADFVSGNFQDCFFSGLLDCGIFKITRDTVEYTFLQYTNADNFFNYLKGVGNDWGYDGTVSGYYGEHTIFKLGTTYYNKIYIEFYNGREGGSADVTVYNTSKESDGVLIFRGSASGVSPWSYTLYYNYLIVYRQLDALIMSVSDLPKIDPHIGGMAWNSSGTLKISAG